MSHNNPRYSPPDRLAGPVPPLEIIEAPRVLPKQLVIVLRVDPGAEPVKVALSAVRLVASVQAADRKLKLRVDSVRSRVDGEEVTLVFVPGFLGVLAAGMLEKVVEVAREAATAFEGATLTRVEVVARG